MLGSTTLHSSWAINLIWIQWMCKTTVPINYSRYHSSYPFWRSPRPWPWAVGSPCSPCWGRGSTAGPCCPHSGSHRLCSSKQRWCMGRGYGRTIPPQGSHRSWCPEQRVDCGSSGWKEIAEEESSYSLMGWTDQLNWGIRQPRVWERKQTNKQNPGRFRVSFGQLWTAARISTLLPFSGGSGYPGRWFGPWKPKPKRQFLWH